MRRKIIGVTVGSNISPESMSEKIGFDPETNATKKWVQDGYQPKGNYLTEHQDISGKLDASKLSEAIDTALAQAKASGDFDGKDGSDGQDGYTPQKNVDYFDGKDGSDGKNGQDGVSPVVSVSAITGGHRITITDKNGTKTVDVMDGEDGKNGSNGNDGNGIKSVILNADYTLTLTFDDGTSYTTPSIRGATGSSGSNGKDGTSATHSWNGTTLTITSASGTSSANLKGEKGDKGDKGDSVKGDTGSPGADGVSPTVAVSKSGKVTTVTITDKNGAKTATINDGADGSNGKDGTSVTVKSVSESTADGGSNVVTFSDNKTVTIKNGKTGGKGDPGYTPQKGTDYWTEADQEAIVQQVLTVMGMHIVGEVQASNKLIIFRGELPDGTYTGVYEKADGTQVPVGTFEHSDADAEIVNLIAESIDVDGTPYNNGIGYKIGYRYSNTDYSLKSEAGYSVTGFIPIENGNIKNVYHLENIYHNDTDNPCITLYDENFNLIIKDGAYPLYKTPIRYIADIIGTEFEYGCALDGAQLLSFTVYALKYWMSKALVETAKYFRIVSAGTMDDTCKVIFNGETI